MNRPAEPPTNNASRAITEIGDRALAGWEIASVASSVAIAEWMLVSLAGYSKTIIAIPVALAVLFMFVSHCVRGENLRDIGFRFDNFARAIYLLAVPMIVVGLLFLIIGSLLGTEVNFLRWSQNRNLALRLVLGFLWALAQQYVLQGFFNRRAVLAVGPGWLSALIVGVIFGLLHLPNPWISLVTLLGGVIWAAVYQRAPNLFALAATHSLMTWFAISTLPPSSFRPLRVGIGYFG